MRKKSKLLVLLVSSIVSLNICNASEKTITFKGLEYKEITSSKTSKTWLDRNLGAKNACSSFSDTSCIGDYYQWGREADGHEKISSSVSKTIAKNLDEVGSNYIEQEDWVVYSEENTLKRQQNWRKTDGSSICPVEFRVPTIEELENEDINFLNLSKFGHRIGSDINKGHTIMWSSDINKNKRGTSMAMYFNQGKKQSFFRIHATNIRCIKD